MLKLMREKGLVERGDGPRGYIWSAKVSRESARTGLLGKLLDLVFDGSAQRLIAHVLEEDKLSDQDREAIRRMLDTTVPTRTVKKKGSQP
jgi:predicted transcriptional regulator